jgi:dihydropyrimidinase
MSMVHCEDGALNAFLTGLCSNESAPLGTDAVYCPADSIESAAVRRVTAFAEAAAAPVYLVHLASASSLDAALEARGRGVAVAVETRPEYLLLSDVELAQASGSAPGGATTARGDHDLERLWSAIERGELDTVCTDHAPWAVVPDRQPSSSMRSARSGLGCLEWARSLLYSRGVLAGKISLERLVAVTSTNPARLFGLYPGKGTIAPGGDADLAIFDPGASWAVSQDRQSRASWSALGGWALTGRTTETIRRGEVVFRLADGFFATGGGRRQASR